MSENDTLGFGGFISPPGPEVRQNSGEGVNIMNYQKLYEKHARSQRQRGYIAIAAGVVNIVAGILMLKQLRDEQE